MGLPQLAGDISYTNNLQLMTTLIPAEFMGGEPGTYVPVKFGTQHNASASIIANQMRWYLPCQTNDRNTVHQGIDQTGDGVGRARA